MAVIAENDYLISHLTKTGRQLRTSQTQFLLHFIKQIILHPKNEIGLGCENPCDDFNTRLASVSDVGYAARSNTCSKKARSLDSPLPVKNFGRNHPLQLEIQM